MLYYNGSFHTLEDLEKDYCQVRAPKVFSFAGLLARVCNAVERHKDGSIEVRLDSKQGQA